MEDFWTVAIGPDLQVELLPCAASSTRTWVNQRVPLVQQLGWCRTTTFSSYEQLGTSFYLRELLCRREEVLSVPRISFSESVVFHLDFWVSSFLLCFWFVFVFWGCFVSAFGRHLAFCFSPALLQLENSWPTTRRFDDRPSLECARHELKKNKQGNWKRREQLWSSSAGPKYEQRMLSSPFRMQSTGKPSSQQRVLPRKTAQKFRASSSTSFSDLSDSFRFISTSTFPGGGSEGMGEVSGQRRRPPIQCKRSKRLSQESVSLYWNSTLTNYGNLGYLSPMMTCFRTILC